MTARTAAFSCIALACLLTSRPAPAFQAAKSPPPEFDLSSSEMRPLIEGFSSDRGNLLRTYNIEGSPSQRNRLKQFYGDWRNRLAALKFETFSQDGKIDYILLRRYLDHELQRLDFEARDQAETAPYTPFSQTILQLEETRKKMEPVKSAEAAATLTMLVKQVEEIRRSVEYELRGQGAPDQKRRVLGNRAANSVTSLRNTLRTWFNFYNGYDPLFTWWNGEPYKAADTALGNYINFLRERLAGLRPAIAQGVAPDQPAEANGRGGGRGPAAAARPGESDDIIGKPIGRDGLISELTFEMIPYTPEELISIAEKEFAWCENEMKRASREMGFGDDWKKALEKVKTMYVEPGKQPDLIRDLALEAEKFVDERDLITIPALARETWRMSMMSPQAQLVNPFFTGGETITVSYPTNTMSHEQKMMSMRGNNIPFARATVFHELIPGHELQGFIAARFRPYRSALGNTPFITEGWALYWELLLWDMKFQKTPEDRVGALFWRMHRCARIIFSLSFHLSKMTPDECIKFLIDRVGHEPENATAEVRRSFGGDYGPLYQAAYLLGGMQLYALRKDLVDSGKMTNRQFHDAVLRENRMPVELIRSSLTQQSLTRDYSTSWKFYGNAP